MATQVSRDLSAIVGAIAVVLSGGCIYATGVQDYKVDDNSTSGGEQPCKDVTSDLPSCVDCCANRHQIDAQRFNNQLQACACGDPGTCFSPCSAPDANFCSNENTPIKGSACGECVNTHIDEGTCPVLGGNLFYKCGLNC
jgi:hypothetical protein